MVENKIFSVWKQNFLCVTIKEHDFDKNIEIDEKKKSQIILVIMFLIKKLLAKPFLSCPDLSRLSDFSEHREWLYFSESWEFEMAV